MSQHTQAMLFTIAQTHIIEEKPAYVISDIVLETLAVIIQYEPHLCPQAETIANQTTQQNKKDQ